MNRELVTASGTTIATTRVGIERPDGCEIIWGHGWGQTGSALAPLAESLGRSASSLVIDFPGFGQSPQPPAVWGTSDYADAVAEWIRTLPPRRRIWIGHSFGCRVGVQLAARHPELIAGMVLISAAGLPPRRKFTRRVQVWTRKWAFKTAKIFVPEGPARDRLRGRFGSADYRAAGPMRAILTGVVNENLTAEAASVNCPTLLIYGANDNDTPPEMGRRYQALIARSELVVLEGFDHMSVIQQGRHQVAHLIQGFLERLCR